MKRAGNLLGPILERDNLRLAYWKAARGKRAQRDAWEFALALDGNLTKLAGEVGSGSYQVGSSHQFTIFDPKERLITAPCFRDRVLHHAIMNICEPYLDRQLIHDTYACRRGKGRIAAVDRAWEYAREYEYFVKFDIRRYFDSISHARLEGLLKRRFKDRRLLELLTRIIEAYWTSPGRGVPIGSLTSQHFANLYLAPVDRFMKESLKVGGYVRYMDDFVAWGDRKADLLEARACVVEFLDVELELACKAEPYLNRCRVGMDFLGCRVFPSHVALSRRSRVHVGRYLRSLEREREAGRIGSLEAQHRATAVLAFARAGPTSSWR